MEASLSSNPHPSHRMMLDETAQCVDTSRKRKVGFSSHPLGFCARAAFPSWRTPPPRHVIFLLGFFFSLDGRPPCPAIFLQAPFSDPLAKHLETWQQLEFLVKINFVQSEKLNFVIGTWKELRLLSIVDGICDRNWFVMSWSTAIVMISFLYLQLYTPPSFFSFSCAFTSNGLKGEREKKGRLWAGLGGLSRFRGSLPPVTSPFLVCPVTLYLYIWCLVVEISSTATMPVKRR